MSIDVKVNHDGGQSITAEKTAPPAQITVSQIMDDLENGRDRKAIKAKYGLTADEVKMIFEHPKLKGVRVKKSKVIRFTLVDDVKTKTSDQITLGDVIEEISTEVAESIATQKHTDYYTNNKPIYDNQSEIKD